MVAGIRFIKAFQRQYIVTEEQVNGAARNTLERDGKYGWEKGEIESS